MKTSNKLISLLFIVMLIALTSTLISLKSSMVVNDIQLLDNSGKVITKDIGKLGTDILNLMYYEYVLDPNSENVIIEGPENIVNNYDVSASEKEFVIRTKWKNKKMDDSFFVMDQPELAKLKIVIGVMGKSSLNISAESNASISCVDTIKLKSLILQTDRESPKSIDLSINSKLTSVNLSRGHKNISLEGQTDHLSLRMQYHTMIDAENLKCTSADLSLFPNSKTQINVSEMLTGTKAANSSLSNVSEAEITSLKILK